MYQLLYILIINIFTLSNSEILSSCLNPKHIALTFDDGPHDNTPNILQILNRYNIKATFFINNINTIYRTDRMNLVKRLYNNGHLIGTHGFKHKDMLTLSEFDRIIELYENELYFRNIFKVRPYYYRPAYYSYDDNIIKLTERFGYKMITCNIDTNDWKASNEIEILNEFKSKLINNTVGYIILQHDHQLLNNKILKNMIDYSLSLNYKFVTLNDCVGSVIKYQNNELN